MHYLQTGKSDGWSRWRGAVMLFWLSLSPALAQMGFQVSPSKIYVNAASQSEQSVPVHVKNIMDTPLTLQFSCLDWQRDSTGNKVYYPSGTLPTSCCPLVSATPTLIELPPRAERDVLVTVRPSLLANQDQIQHGMLFLTQVNDPQMNPASGAQIAVKVQVGLMLYVVPQEGRQPAIAITDMRLTRTPEQQVVKVQVHNKGGTLLESQLRLEYLNLSTMEELKIDPVPVNTMPNDRFRVSSVVPSVLQAGKYLIVAILDNGPGQPMKVAELETVLTK